MLIPVHLNEHSPRSKAHSKRYREQAEVNVQISKKVKSLSAALSATQKKLSNEQVHRTSVKTHRTTANSALEQRNVALDKLKAVEQERDRWEAKYVPVHCTWLLIVV